MLNAVLKLRKIVLWGGVFFTFFFNGCLYSVQHFNHGKTVQAGDLELQVSAGIENVQNWSCQDMHKVYHGDTWYGCESYDYTSLDFVKDTIVDPVESIDNQFVFAFSYRHGLMDSLWIFPGLDMGLMSEIHEDEMLLEYDVRVGMPVFSGWEQWHHSISVGWIIGWWVNNSWFVEYAISRKFYSALYLFGSYRALSLSKEFDGPPDLNWHESIDPEGAKKIGHQASLGLRYEPLKSSLFYGFSGTLNKHLPSVSSREIPSMDRKTYTWTGQMNVGVRF